MLDHLQPSMSRREVLERVLAAERDASALLKEASEVVEDPLERELYAELVRRQALTLAELKKESERLEAEEYVTRAMGC